MMIDLYPEICNLCGGKVIYTSNAVIYGKEYGSGKCYLCKSCGGYVGTHVPRPKEAYGILADDRMRCMKQKCHELFDRQWINEPKEKKRSARKCAYRKLAAKMQIPVKECHFGYFNMEQLNMAYALLQEENRDTFN